MPRTGWTPSIVPYGADQTVYLVVDSFGRLGTPYRETDVERTDLETAIADLMSGQFNDPVRVVAFNTLEHWAQDVSKDIALEIQSRCDIDGHDVPETLGTLSSATPVLIGSSPCGWQSHDQPSRHSIPQIGPRRAGQPQGSTAAADRRRSGSRRLVHSPALPSRQNRNPDQIGRR
jgi:hypothetical protein